MKNSIKIIFSTLLLAITSILLLSFIPQGEIKTSIDSPGYDNYQVGKNMLVQGTAKVNPEHFVWVFARPSSFEPLWYPQGQVIIDPSDNSWYRMVYFGVKEDIGTTFDIAVAVFNEKEHLQLQKYWEDAMTKEDWKPIKMPAPVAAPALRKVMKARH